MRYEQEAIWITPPTGNDQVAGGNDVSLDLGACRSVAITTASSAVITLPQCTWVEFTADVDAYIRFWRDDSLGAAAAGDYPIWQYAYKQWVCDGFRYFRVRSASASGTLFYVVSSR